MASERDEDLRRVRAVVGGDFGARDLADGDDDFGAEVTRNEALRDDARESGRASGNQEDDEPDDRGEGDEGEGDGPPPSRAESRAGARGGCHASLRRALLTAAQNSGAVSCRALTEGMRAQGVTLAILVRADGSKVVMR